MWYRVVDLSQCDSTRVALLLTCNSFATCHIMTQDLTCIWAIDSKFDLN